MVGWGELLLNTLMQKDLSYFLFRPSTGHILGDDRPHLSIARTSDRSGLDDDRGGLDHGIATDDDDDFDRKSLEALSGKREFERRRLAAVVRRHGHVSPHRHAPIRRAHLHYLRHHPARLQRRLPRLDHGREYKA